MDFIEGKMFSALHKVSWLVATPRFSLGCLSLCSRSEDS